MTKEASEIGVCINSIAKSFFLMNSVPLKKTSPEYYEIIVFGKIMFSAFTTYP